jgi:hypothetical protein
MVLGTLPDAAELAEWSGRLEEGKAKITALIEAMFRSGAFRDRYSSFGMPDRTYVSFLYRLLLNRVADNDGRDSYLKQLAAGTMTRTDVAVGLATSNEFRVKHPGLFSQNPKMGPAASQSATGE